jgi:L-seryl-tRNA(Ser) seleniumtransferase
VTMSGDKLLGGPQAGIVLGKAKCIGALRKNPMMRALRLGKLSLAALEAALIPFINGSRLKEDVPLFAALSADMPSLKKIANRLAKAVKESQPEMAVSVEPSDGSVGGGSLPGKTVPSYAAVLSHPRHSSSQLAALFRRFSVPVIGTYCRNRFALNVRSLLKGEEKEIISFVRDLKL